MDTGERSSFGMLLRRYRLAVNLSQAELAERAGLSIEAISTLERGVRRSPHGATVRLLAEALRLQGPEQAAFEVAAHQQNAAIAAAPLPVSLTPLLGREHEEAAIAHLLGEEQVHLLTLTGPGGVGKTRLGLQVAADLLDLCPDGAFFVNLAPIRDPGLVAVTIAQTLDVEESLGQSLVETIAAAVRGKRLLLLLDNFEQVLAATPQVVDLLSLCPVLKILVTSRAPLHVRGEYEFAVPPLAVPPTETSADVTTLPQYAAVALFVQCARAVKPDFALTAGNAAAVAAICVHLDGLPLAIELAAARIKLLSPRALRERLETRLALLTHGPEDLPARLQTMRDTICWSYDLLDSAEQGLFQQLAVFVGGCTLEAAEAVCGMADDQGRLVLDGLTALVDKSLLRVEEQADGECRFGMFETIREYALERLAASEEVENLRHRHAQYYLALAEKAGPELRGAEQGTWMARLEAERSNVQAALQWYRAHQEAVLAMRLSAALSPYLAQRFWQRRRSTRS